LAAPLEVEWELTNACNLSCRHCYVNAGERLSRELTTKEALNLIAELDQIGISNITLSGGEPFLRSDIWEIVEDLKRRHIPFVVYTNGTLLHRATIQKLVEAKTEAIATSLNGATARTHNYVQNAITFRKVLETIKELRKKNVKVIVLFTLMKINQNEVKDLVKLTQDLDVNDLCIYPFFPAGRGNRNLEILDIDAKTAFSILEETITQNVAGSPHIVVGGCVQRWLSSEKRRFCLKRPPCARIMAVITPDGHLRPCNFLPFRTKSGIREKRISELWKEPIFERIRDWNKHLRTNCVDCQRFLLCRGACLSMHMDKLDARQRNEFEALVS
jgi:radical SAM protein with 4Fe4S-binding SPASM domain